MTGAEQGSRPGSDRGRLRAVIVGLGWWGRKIAELCQRRSRRIALVRAVEPRMEEARTFAENLGLRLSSSYEEALADPGIEAVVIATPHSLHETQIRLAAEAGKHVFCEKPIALTRAGAEASVRACADRNLVLGVGHERRFDPPVAELLALAEAGQLGRLLQIEANFSHDRFLHLEPSNWRLDREQAPAAGMTATGIHLTDLAVKLLGRAAEVHVVCERLASNFAQGDTLSAHIRFVAGGTAYVSASLATPFFSRFAVFGTRGWFDIRDKNHVEKPEGWVVTCSNGAGGVTVREVSPAEPVLDNLEAFAAAVRGEAPYPISGQEIVDNTALLEAITCAARSGGIAKVA